MAPPALQPPTTNVEYIIIIITNKTKTNKIYNNNENRTKLEKKDS